eukprot:6325037-Lingulodinium_polyedra.AAC.1
MASKFGTSKPKHAMAKAPQRSCGIWVIPIFTHWAPFPSKPRSIALWPLSAKSFGSFALARRPSR